MGKFFIRLKLLKIYNLFREKVMMEIIPYKCNSCGMDFFKHSDNNLKKNKKVITCPYCGSELCIPIITVP